MTYKEMQSTVSFQLAPNYNKHNCYIRNGYRKKLSVKNCFLSTFQWTNETINIWSHYIGFLIFVALLIYDSTVLLYEIDTTLYERFIAAFAILSFMACMLLSSLYHTLSCHSPQLLEHWLSLDIFGISVAFFAIFISGIYYGFCCQQHFHLQIIYSGLVVVLFFVAMQFVLVPSLRTDKWDAARLTLFVSWALSGVLPTLHWAVLYKDSDSGIIEIFLTRIAVMYGLSGVAVMCYFFRMPERFFPGRFDFIGSSHQWWHLIMLVALYYWHQSGVIYAYHKNKFSC